MGYGRSAVPRQGDSGGHQIQVGGDCYTIYDSNGKAQQAIPDGNGGWTYTNIIQTPNRDSVFPGGGCRFNCAGCGIDSSFSYAVSSNHSGGANVLMADGSVRFVKDGVSRPTWWALGTRNGGEVISADSY